MRQLLLQHLQAVPNVEPLPPGAGRSPSTLLSKKPADRFPTCRELIAASAGLPHGTPGEQPGPPPDRADAGPAARLVARLSPRRPDPPTAGVASCWPRRPPTRVSRRTSALIEPSVLRGPGIGACEGEKPAAPAEVTGPGCLFPALVIGLGQMGLSVLQKVRETLHTFAAPLSQLSNVRFLLLDTDAEVMRTASRCVPAAALNGNEVLIAPLNRPSHYLKPRDGRPPLALWLHPSPTLRIPRLLVTTRVRPRPPRLHRQLPLDHPPTAASKLDSALDPQTLQSSARLTRLRAADEQAARVYVIAGLGGGSGSGMFLDVAYNVRALLRRMGYENPDVVGLFLLPAVEAGRPHARPAAGQRLRRPDRTEPLRLAGHHVRGEVPRPRGARQGRRAALLAALALLPLPAESDEAAAR